MAQQVVDVGHIGVERKKELAHRHQYRNGKQANGTETPGRSQTCQKQQCSRQIECNQAIFKADLERGQPLSGDEGARHPAGLEQKQIVQASQTTLPLRLYFCVPQPTANTMAAMAIATTSSAICSGKRSEE